MKKNPKAGKDESRQITESNPQPKSKFKSEGKHADWTPAESTEFFGTCEAQESEPQKYRLASRLASRFAEQKSTSSQ
jgi:hypothetical protein